MHDWVSPSRRISTGMLAVGGTAASTGFLNRRCRAVRGRGDCIGQHLNGALEPIEAVGHTINLHVVWLECARHEALNLHAVLDQQHAGSVETGVKMVGQEGPVAGRRSIVVTRGGLTVLFRTSVMHSLHLPVGDGVRVVA